MFSRLLIGGGASFVPTPWTGVLSLGAITSVTDDTYYNAWPVNCRMANGNILLAYTKALTHHAENSGNAVAKISTDDGATWSSESSIYFDIVTPLWATVMGVSTISTGRVFATLWKDDTATTGTGQAGIVYSDDNGGSWTSWIDLSNGFTQEAYGTGPVVEDPLTGHLLVTIEGSNSGDPIANRSCHTLRSTDGGATWGSEVVVRDYDTRPYYESKLGWIDEQLVVIHRTSGLTGTHYMQRSLDRGATAGGWTTPVAVFDGFGAPSWTRSISRTLFVVTRRNSDSAAVAFASLDGGATWSGDQVLDDTMYEMEYGCPLDTLDGRLVIHYGYQPTSSISNSDIKQVYVTEGHA